MDKWERKRSTVFIFYSYCDIFIAEKRAFKYSMHLFFISGAIFKIFLPSLWIWGMCNVDKNSLGYEWPTHITQNAA